MKLEWEEIKSLLRKTLPRGQYDLWIATLNFLGLREGELHLGCRNWLHVEWLRERMHARLLSTVRSRYPQVKNINYVVESSEVEEDHTPPRARQVAFSDVAIPPGSIFNPRFTFDQFVVGQSNQFAYAASKAIALGQRLYNPGIFLVASTGLGKSHLTQAVGNHLQRQRPEIKVQYVTAEQFANEMISCLKKDRMEQFKRKYRQDCDILLFEGLEFLARKDKIQDELVFTIDELFDRGKRVVCTGNKPPSKIPHLKLELRSRLSGILVAPIEQPDFSTRAAIIRRKAAFHNISLPGDVVEFLADTISGDVRQLESCLIGLIAKSSLLRVPISVELASDVCKDMVTPPSRVTIEKVIDTICDSFRISKSELRSSLRERKLVLARHIGIYLCKHYTSESVTAIGKAFGRNHSTVIYALKRIEKELQASNSGVKHQIELITCRLRTQG